MIADWVRQHLAGVLGVAPDQVALDRTLDSYGLDSVEAVLMAGALEDALGVQIDPAAFLQYPTLAAMVAALENGAGRAGLQGAAAAVGAPTGATADGT